MQTASSPNQLVAEHLEYAEALTVETLDRFNLRPLINFDEALCFANAALTEAAHRYQPRVGRTGQSVPFTTFSFTRIRGAVIDGVRRTRASRTEHGLSRQTRAALEQRTAPFPRDFAAVVRPPSKSNHEHADFEHPADVTAQNPAFARETEHALHRETIEALGLRDSVLRAIRRLPEIEQQVIFLHFYEDLSCERLATRLGISGSYALRLRNKALGYLRTLLKEFNTDCTKGAVQ
jgi:RNA polymerase sigma factor (sigma-70 family)